MRIEVQSPARPENDYTIIEPGVMGTIQNFNNERVCTHEFSEDEVRVILGADNYRKFTKQGVSELNISRGKLDLIRGARQPLTRRDNETLLQLL